MPVFPESHARLGFSIFVGLFAALLVSLGTWAAIAGQQYAISQKGRQFNPEKIIINRSDTLELVNDDGDLRHHAYIDADKFTFDSGDQEPGSRTKVTFPVAGDFEVLCAIHPKMKLAVHVK
jgi:plastocyanin